MAAPEIPFDDPVRAARDGSQEALGYLVDVCTPGIQAYLEHLTGPGVRRVVSVSDLRQDVLLQGKEALQHLPDGADVEDFRALLFQHARWAVGKAARKRGQFDGESTLGKGADGQVRVPSPSAPSVGEVTHADEMAWLEVAIERLEPKLAAVVRLRLEEHTFADIGRFLEISETAVRKRFALAAGQLRRSKG